MKKPLIRYAFPAPVFFRNGKRTSKDVWAESVYYLWWEFLRRNRLYLKACEEQDRESFRIMNLFDDVRADDFKAWWSDKMRGMETFGEPIEWNTMKSIPPYSTDPYLWEKGMLVIKVPLHLPQTYLKRTFNKLLKQHHRGKKGKRYAYSSKAQYKPMGQPKIKALARILKVYDLKHSDAKPTHYQIAMSVKDIIHKKHLFLADDLPHTITAKKRIMASTVSRLLLNADKLIHNVAYGRFPDFKDYKDRKAKASI